jgi:phthalate 4,5-cis-dihydrodiol dehydrogenase
MPQKPLKLRLGIIGLGRAAALMIPALAAHPNVRLAAAADPNPQARARFETEFGGRAFADAFELCASDLVDAVYIATPHDHHVIAAAAAAAHRRHILVEKPMALTLEDCRAMTAAAAAANVVLVVGHTHAFNPATRIMREVIRSGTVGRLRIIVNVVYTNWLYRPRRAEELNTSAGGGIMFNQVPHQVELLRALTGTPIRSVRAVTGIWDPSRRTEGAIAAFVTFADGAAAQITYSGYDHFDTDELHWWIAESGDERPGNSHAAARSALATVETPARERELRIGMGYGGRGTDATASPMHDPHFGLLIASCDGADLRPGPDGVIVYADDGVRMIPSPSPRAYPNKDGVIDEFYDAIAFGTQPEHDGGWATETMAAVLALMRSAREGREITLERQIA